MKGAHPAMVGAAVWSLLLLGTLAIGRWAFQEPVRLPTPPPRTEPRRVARPVDAAPFVFDADQRRRDPPEAWARRAPRGLPAEGFLAASAPALSEAETRLGAALFRSPAILGEDAPRGCATCHDPAWDFRDPRGRGGPHALVDLAYLAPYRGTGGFERLQEAVAHAWRDRDPPARFDVDALRATEPLLAEACEETWGTPLEPTHLARGLAAYLALNRSAPGDAATGTDDAVARGRAAFEGRGDCSRCHPRPLYTSRAGDPTRRDVPTLLGDLEARAPYLGGGAATLEELLERHEAPDPPWDGATRRDLVAFLRSLRGDPDPWVDARSTHPTSASPENPR